MGRRIVLVPITLALLGAWSERALFQPVTQPAPPRADLAYAATDLGTLGGASSLPLSLNNERVVVGFSYVRGGSQSAFAWKNGVMRDLGGFGGRSVAEAINDRGQIAGISDDPVRGPRPFLWENGVMRDIGPIDAGAVQVQAMNNSGHVAGTISLAGHTRSFLWRDGVVRYLGSVQRDRKTLAIAMNDRGQIVGRSVGAFNAMFEFYHPFLWSAGAIRDLGVLGPASCPGTEFCAAEGWAQDINELGHTVAWSTDSAGIMRTVLWKDGQPHTLDVFPGHDVRGVAINDLDQIAGNYWSGNPWSDEPNGFLWQDGVARDLGSLGGGRTRVLAMNAHGHVVGYSMTPSGEQHAFAWADGRMVDLGLGPQGGQFSVAVAINDHGDVIGHSGTAAGIYRAIIWTATAGWERR